MFIVIIQILFAAFNVWAGKYQAHRFDVEQKKILHFVWAYVYGLAAWIAVVFMYRIEWHGLLSFIVSNPVLFFYGLILQRIPFFNTSLNYHRIPRRPLFYTNPVWSKKAEQSFFNKLWGKWYPAIFFMSIALLITLQFFIYDSN